MNNIIQIIIIHINPTQLQNINEFQTRLPFSSY
jgi:hypothetical protein